MRKTILNLAAYILVLFLPTMAISKISGSAKIFFNSELGQAIEDYQSFSATWWNYIAIPSDQPQTLQVANKLCQHLKSASRVLIQRVECQQSLEDYLPLIKSWVADLPFRTPPPSYNMLKDSFSMGLSEASLPLPPSVLSIIRLDPLKTHESLIGIESKNLPIEFKKENGFLKVKDLNFILIPIQMNYKPTSYDQTRQFTDLALKSCGQTALCDQLLFSGPHFANKSNRDQIEIDLTKVNTVGAIILSLFILGFLFFRGRSLLIMIPPVLIAVATSGLITHWIWGSIHGLTLSFGSGIIGLSFDYAFHGFVKSRTNYFWKSNYIGLITTLMVLLTMSFSEIPLIRELMVFSIIGLTVAFSLLYIFRKFVSDKFLYQSYPINVSPYKITPLILVLILAGWILSFIFIRPSLDMSQFDFQQNNIKALNKQLFRSSDKPIPLFKVNELSETKALDAEWRLHQESGIPLNQIRNYFPNRSEQQKNLNLWTQWSCSKKGQQFFSSLSKQTALFYAPFLNIVNCNSIEALKPPIQKTAYTQKMISNNKSLTIWLPNNTAQESLITSQFPGTMSLKALVSEFPKVLSKELTWMAPLSFVLVLIVLFLYYRNLKYLVAATIPFLTAYGLISWASVLFNITISFVSLVALIMVYGLSIDYGVFTVDKYLFAKKDNSLWTTLIFAALTSLSGFFPLIFAQHPVLFHLGITLILGTIGTLLGSMLILPWWMKRL